MKKLVKFQPDYNFVDTNTGLILGNGTIVAVETPESKKKRKKIKTEFSMINNDENFDKFDFDVFTNPKEILLMILLSKLQPQSERYITLNQLHYQYLVKILKISKPSISSLISKLVKKDLIRRICDSTYMVNPYLFYKGYSDTYKETCFYWDNIKFKEDIKPLEEQESN
jgi:predicted XRE-type DNA-binding protein